MQGQITFYGPPPALFERPPRELSSLQAAAGLLVICTLLAALGASLHRYTPRRVPLSATVSVAGASCAAAGLSLSARWAMVSLLQEAHRAHLTQLDSMALSQTSVAVLSVDHQLPDYESVPSTPPGFVHVSPLSSNPPSDATSEPDDEEISLVASRLGQPDLSPRALSSPDGLLVATLGEVEAEGWLQSLPGSRSGLSAEPGDWSST